MTRHAPGPGGACRRGSVLLALAIPAIFACQETDRPVGPDSTVGPAADMRSGDRSPMFDFSDDFYRDNGLDPSAIAMRAGNPDRDASHWTVDEAADATRRDIRLLEHTGGWDNSGNLIYYTIQGMVTPATFAHDAAGREARQIADAFRAFLFPKTQPDGSAVLDPAPSNRRQDNVFDTRNGYFSNNPLGLWVLTFVVYTDAAKETPEGRERLAELAARNGTDLEGTPILQTVSEIEGLSADGFVQLLERPKDGSQGPPWVI